MNEITLKGWLGQLQQRFDERTLQYLVVHKAQIVLQLKDKETGQIHLHEIEYLSRSAQNLKGIKTRKEGGQS